MGKALKAASVSQAKTKKKKPNNKVLTNMEVAKTMEKPDASEGDPIFSKNPWSTYVRSYCPHHVRFDATSIYLKMDKGGVNIIIISPEGAAVRGWVLGWLGGWVSGWW